MLRREEALRMLQDTGSYHSGSSRSSSPGVDSINEEQMELKKTE